MSLFWYAVFMLFFGTAAYAGWRGAPWVPTRKKELAQALAFVQTQPTPRVGIDLGCGTGSLLFLLAEHFPSLELRGYDVSFGPLLFGWIRKWISPKRYKNVHLYWKNLYHVDVHDADFIFVFMMPEPHTRIAHTVLSRARSDAFVLFEAWPPEGFSFTEKLHAPEALPLFVYRGSAFSSRP